MPDKCVHAKKQIVWTTVNNSGYEMETRQLRHQCLECGKLLAGALPYSKATQATPSVDLVALERWWDNEQAGWRQRREQQDEMVRQRTERYHMYLQWAERCALVLDRANGICEGCRQRKATQVHHLTYQHAGEEFLWELVAVCRECHERVHGGEE